MMRDLIDWIYMDLECNPKIARVCRLLDTNPVQIYDLNKEDLLNRALVIMLRNEFNEILNELQARMELEAQMEENQWFGVYMPGDAFFEAEIELNSLIDNLNDLIDELEPFDNESRQSAEDEISVTVEEDDDEENEEQAERKTIIPTTVMTDVFKWLGIY
jgi:hypothetical protein